jgi:hypothetical protein
MSRIEYQIDINAPVERDMNTTQTQTTSKKLGLEI